MLSYQHAYHAGNRADIHKHTMLCAVLDYLTQKDKPLSYIETHAGRGLYDLDSPEARKTGEAAAGIMRLGAETLGACPAYQAALDDTKKRYGAQTYPGSPLLAAQALRPDDRIHLCEKHPQEGAALKKAMQGRAKLYLKDGYEAAMALIPPAPRRGLMLIDPSYEVKSEYPQAAEFLAKAHRKWPVGVLMLWYPILKDSRHLAMVAAIEKTLPGLYYKNEITFPPMREGHGLIGSGLILVNPPYGIEAMAKNTLKLFL